MNVSTKFYFDLTPSAPIVLSYTSNSTELLVQLLAFQQLADKGNLNKSHGTSVLTQSVAPG